jgi:hypothetical protein
MLFWSYRPARPLSDFVEHFWLYDGYSSAYVHERIFPTGAFDLVFNLRGDGLRIYEGNNSLLCRRYSGALDLVVHAMRNDDRFLEPIGRRYPARQGSSARRAILPTNILPA